MIVFMSPTHIGVTIPNFDIAVVSNSCGSNIRIARGNSFVALSALRSYQIFAIPPVCPSAYLNLIYQQDDMPKPLRTVTAT